MLSPSSVLYDHTLIFLSSSDRRAGEGTRTMSHAIFFPLAYSKDLGGSALSGSLHGGNASGNLEEIAPKHHLHPGEKSISLPRRPLSWCCRLFGVPFDITGTWGHCCQESQRCHSPKPFLLWCGEGLGKSFKVFPAGTERGQGGMLFVYMPCIRLGTMLRRTDRSCRKAE